jgi:PAS domain S-box-containing protein
LQLLGYKEAELRGQWFPRKIIAVTDRDVTVNLIDRPITRAFLTGEPVSEKMHYRTKNGNRIPVAVNVSPILFEGKPIGAIEVFRDVSIEDEIDRMKSEFISLASHQLRTPLSAIKTYSHMLVDGYMGEITNAQEQSLKTIIGAADRMNELISTLLNITRIESGAINITMKPLRIDKIVNELVKETKPLADDKSITMTHTATGSATFSVRTDNLIVREIISNFISNAIKYTPNEGNITIRSRARKSDVLISVADDGWGIPIHLHEQVFTKFFRAQNIVKRETTGTGLGLYLVKGLAERINAKVWFESQEGKGAIFYLLLPRARSRKAKITSV